MTRRIVIVLRVALAFLTRVPGAHPEGATDSDFALAQSMVPLVGLLIGCAVALVQLGAMALGVPPFAAVGVALAAGLMLTGALHEDGLADVADGFGGGGDRAAKLEIMRDSRVGSYGALALITIMIVKAGSMVELRGAAAIAALSVAHAVSRTAATVVSRLLRPARSDGLGAGAGRPVRWGVATSLAISLASAFLLVPVASCVPAILCSVVLTAAMCALANKQIGGYTGDVLGATQQVVEAGILLALAARPAVQ